METDRKRKSPLGGVAQRKLCDDSDGWLHLLLVLCTRSSSVSHRFGVISASSCWENWPEAEFSGRLRYKAEVIGSFDWLLSVIKSVVVGIPRPCLIIFKLLVRENWPEAWIDDTWRQLAEEIWSFDTLNLVSYWCSAYIPRPSFTVFLLLALFRVVKTNRKPISPLGGAACRRWYGEFW